MIDPATAMLIASAVSAAGSAITGNKTKKAAKLRAEEMKRETEAGLLQDTLSRGAELEGHRLSSRAHMGKRRARSMQDTADIVRGAFNI